MAVPTVQQGGRGEQPEDGVLRVPLEGPDEVGGRFLRPAVAAVPESTPVNQLDLGGRGLRLGKTWAARLHYKLERAS